MWQSFLRRVHFTLRYLRGQTPWDSGIVPPEITAWIDQHESAQRPAGRALDLGCGTGTMSRYLAQHGWTVTGVDFAPNAIRQARREARRHNLRTRISFLSADVSRPDLLRDAAPFDLLVDVGCLHGLHHEARLGYAANLARLARPGATYLLYAFSPGLSNDGRRQIGVDEDELRALVTPAFSIDSIARGVEATSLERTSAWYTLRRLEDNTP